MVERTLKALGHDLKSLADKVAEMGIIAERMLATAIDAVVHNDRDLAHSTIAIDKQLDVLLAPNLVGAGAGRAQEATIRGLGTCHSIGLAPGCGKG
jgi:hypothetical protein